MRPLTKSRYKLALDCPTKLFYTKKEEKYPNTQNEDNFLQSLAEGGYQVGELAKCYYPGGYDITEAGYEAPLKRTNELLQQENVIIYEAAILYNNFFIRVDVLKKVGNKVSLIEVKAKSFSGSDNDFTDAKGSVNSTWSHYLEDVAFQKFVTQKAFPNWEVTAYLMLSDKSKKASVNGLNQKFQLLKDNDDRVSAKTVGDVSLNALGDPILTAVNIDDLASRIINDTAYSKKPDMVYEDKLNFYADKYSKDEKIVSQVGLHCFSCEFQSDNPKEKSGFKECWSQFYNWTEEQYNKPKITDIWNFRDKQKLFEEDIIFLNEVHESHIGDTSPNKDGSLSIKERQWLQIQKVQNKDDTFYFDADGMKDFMSSFNYPLHFIDFETSMVAIPFYKGQHPYEQIAFQFSHHIMHEDGKVEHKGEFIAKEKGVFPNFDFLRALKKELENDNGTIFRFAAHENTVLNQILDQLNARTTEEVPDKEKLIEFIKSITHKDNRVGERDMVDMLEMVRKYYYAPQMGGSNSIKAVLPAVLNTSEYIQKRYSNPIYGKNSFIKSLNYEDGWIWIKTDKQGKVISPYKLLPNIFDGIDNETVDSFITNDNIADGGAALTAFAKMQFTEMSETERNSIVKGLLKYCELDTLAMVMIYEFWLNEINNTK